MKNELSTSKNKGFQKLTIITIFISKDNPESTTAKYGDVEEVNETEGNTGIIVGFIVAITILTLAVSLALVLFVLWKRRNFRFSTAVTEHDFELIGTNFESL